MKEQTALLLCMNIRVGHSVILIPDRPKHTLATRLAASRKGRQQGPPAQS